jgi:maltose/maltodextrin transport system permease protein
MNKLLFLKRWMPAALLVLLLMAALYGVVLVYAAGETLLAATMLTTAALALWVYTSKRTYAYRYLFPGIAAVLIFVVFPMLYTIGIGFTNYSSKNLLEFSRATQNFLDETYRAEGDSYASTLHADAAQYRVRLEDPQGKAYLSKPMALLDTKPLNIDMLPEDKAQAALAPALTIKDIIAVQSILKQHSFVLPDGTKLAMAGLREFAPVSPLYAKQADGTLKNQQNGSLIKPNFVSGFYETDAGERLSPGFKVGVGLENYKRIFTDQAFQGPFLRILLWTIIFSALTVVLSCALGMFLAVLFNWDALHFKGLYRTMLFLPYAVPGFISILIFKGLFNNNFGEINLILNALFGIRPPWFSDPFLARTMLVIVNIWLGYPYMMVVCSGLIKAIPTDLYEASAVAGVGPVTNFLKITLPLILKPLTPLLIASFAFNFNNFVLVSLLTGGQPDFLDTTVPAGTTDLLVSYTYRIAFKDSGQQYGLAAAISTVIFVLVAIIALLQMRFTKIARDEVR